MQTPQSLPGQLFLLSYVSGKTRLVNGSELPYALRAAALTDLYLTGNLTTDEAGRPVARGTVADPVLAGILGEVAGSPPRGWERWIRAQLRQTTRAVREQLAAAGSVRLEPHRILGIFPATRVTVLDPVLAARLREEVVATLRPETPAGRVDPRAAALLALSCAAELNTVIGRAQRREAKLRIRELTERSGPVVPALRKVIQAMHADAAIGASIGG